MKEKRKVSSEERGKTVKMSRGKRLSTAVFFGLALGVSGCSVLGGKSPYPEVEQYLKNRYGGKFQIEQVPGAGEETSYRVVQKDGEKLEFEVFPVGDEYTNKGFDDTCPLAFVMKKAGEAGLVLEPGDGQKELVATVGGYEEIGELAGKLAGIADAYKAAGLPAKYTTGTVGDGWNSANIRVEIRDFSPEGYQPGIIRIPDSVTGLHDRETMEQYLEVNYLTFLERYYLGEIPADVPEEAFEAVRGEPGGITVISGDETREYPELEYSDLSFGQVYRMALKEGWEPMPAAEGNSFTIGKGEKNYRFELAFEEKEDKGDREKYKYSGNRTPLGHDFYQEPVVYWSVEGEESKTPANLESAWNRESISAELLEQIAGVEIESGLKLQKARERAEEIRDKVDEYLLRSDVKQPGGSVEIADWRITLNQVEEMKRLETSSMYFEADEGKIFARLDMSVENQGKKKRQFLEMIGTSEDLSVHLISSGGHRYIPVDMIGMTDLASVSVEPGAAENGGLIFHIGENIFREDEHIFLTLEAGGESRGFRIK